MERVIPKQKQLDFLNWELGVFFHFGIRTFYEGHKDWDMKPMPLSGFNPTNLDCEKWLQTVVDMGAKYAVFVTKHHDGFANWPSKYTEYGIKNTPWRDGKGDLVKEYTEACAKLGVKVGLYYSPAEFSLKEGERTGKDYDDYFVNQISELLSNYGKIDYLWFDACGSEGIEYDKVRIINKIRELQPDILIFNLWDPDTRWALNEIGYTDEETFSTSNRAESQLFDHYRFMPVECDTTLRDKCLWFYSEDYNEYAIKSAEHLVDLYYKSIGRGSNLLLNIGPDRRGLLPEIEVERILEFTNEIKRRFENLLYQLENPAPAQEYTIKLDKELCINTIVLEENLENGEGVVKYALSATDAKSSQQVILYEGTSMGHKRIVTFKDITTSEVTLKINNTEHKLNKISFYCVKA